MKINALKAIVALTTTLVLFNLAPKAVALHVSDHKYACDYEMQVKINEDKTVDFIQQINLANLQEKNLLTAMSVNIPFQIYDIKVRNGLLSSPQFIDSVYEKGSIEINLGKYFVEGQHAATYTITYSSNQLIKEDLSGWYSFVLPQLDFCNSAFNTVSITYPESWGEANYSSNNKSSKKIAMYWGDNFEFELDMSWNPLINSAITIPSSNFNELIIKQIEGDVEVHKDNWNNEYLTVLDATQAGNSLKGLVRRKVIPHNLPVITAEYYTKLVESNESYLLTEETRELRYQELLNRLSPSYTLNSQPKLAYSEDALGYALTWATALEAEGVNPYIVFGPVAIPATEEVFWNYWVVLMVNGKFVQYDPYFEDAYGFEGFEKTTPIRQIWGIVSGENQFLIDGLNNITNVQDLLKKTTETNLVLGEKFDIHAILETDKELAKKVNFIVDNKTNHIIYLDEIILDNSILPKELYSGKGVLPLQKKTIDFSQVVSIPDLITKGDKQQVNVLGTINGRQVAIPTKIQINHNSLIFVLFFVVLFLFYYLLLKLILQLRGKMLLKWQKLQPKSVKENKETTSISNHEDYIEVLHKRPEGYRRRIRL